MNINLMRRRPFPHRLRLILYSATSLVVLGLVLIFFYPCNPAHNLDVSTMKNIKPQKQPIISKDGKHLSLNFQNMPLHSAFKLLSDFSHQNIVVSQVVRGNITLRLHEVSWQKAMKIILKLYHLQSEQMGNVLLIDKSKFPNINKVSSNVEPTSEEKPPRLSTHLIQIHYAKAVDIANLLRDKANSLLSEQGAAGADLRTNVVWLRDTSEKFRELRKLISRLDVPHQQVVIDARIVTMNKECAEDLGVRFGVTPANYLSGTLNAANLLQQGVKSSDVPVTDRLNFNLNALPLEGMPATVGVALATLGHQVLLDLELSALESQGKAEIVASPSLMTTNQQTAVIESGEDIPYQETSLNGATSIAFRKAVLSLKVTPQITPEGKLLIELLINQDSDSGRRVQGVPIISTKAIATRVLVNHDETIVLGGIYKKDNNDAVAQIPVLGTMPIIGPLFQRRHESTRKEELLIFITPRIISEKVA